MDIARARGEPPALVSYDDLNPDNDYLVLRI
jgi:hypothetical protein